MILTTFLAPILSMSSLFKDLFSFQDERVPVFSRFPQHMLYYGLVDGVIRCNQVGSSRNDLDMVEIM